MKPKAFFTKLHRPSGSRAVTVAPPVGAAQVEVRDPFVRLPFELHALILAYLGPADFDDGISASRILELIWLSDELLPPLADRWFPGLSQFIRLNVCGEQERLEAFRQTLRGMCKRTAGKFSVAMHYGFVLSPDDFFRLNRSVPTSEGGIHTFESVEGLEANGVQRFSRFMIYCNGRIAWWPEGYSMPYLAVVDDLRQRTRRAYMFPGRDPAQRGYKTAMGNKLFVIGCETTLHVWHLDHNRLQSFEVPDGFSRCVTENETVLVVTQRSDVYIWRFGETLRYIDMHKLPCYPRERIVVDGPPLLLDRYNVWLPSQQGMYLRNSRMLIDFILSPTLSNVFFVITLALDGSGRLTVYEVLDGAIAATYVMEDRIYSDPRTTEKGLLRWHKLNSYGGYCLVQVVQQPSDPAACSCGLRSLQLVSLCFNIYTKKFTPLRHHLGGLFPLVSHVWNDRLLLMNVDVQPPDRKGGPSKTPLLSLAPCIGHGDPRGRDVPIPMYTTMQDDVPPIHRRQRIAYNLEDIAQKVDIEVGLDILQESSPDPKQQDPFVTGVSDLIPGKLVGDDEFLIHVNAPRYTVLGFGNDFPPKLSPSENGSSRSWWRKSRAKKTS
ncbi:hypothetical protein F5Y17DRAFT_251920 [Xylariaceae sp. FL0594]|nr:hypothetical protein F5Y17DRAFT_251920 [Xylariaceae sp. FL0594]